MELHFAEPFPWKFPNYFLLKGNTRNTQSGIYLIITLGQKDSQTKKAMHF